MLDAAQKDLLLRLFEEVNELPAGERPAFVRDACGEDTALRSELEELLQVDETKLAGFLDEPVVAPPEEVSPGLEDLADQLAGHSPIPRIDGYAQLELIAEGGMGAVYRAMQLHPVRREVAVKVIRFGLDHRTVLARFDAERQTLAMMSHPSIATVLDAGSDDTGRPFIAMELVEGVPITDHCERERCSLEERLRLFVEICRAVDYAHRRGVLHRDLKPSNVLVGRSGERACPKIIDFGIAKAMQERPDDAPTLTVDGSCLGTPAYMSPEQLEGDTRRIDTRSDVYSLGVLLYELVTRTRPFETAGSDYAGLVQLSRQVRETVPPKPSTRLAERSTARDTSSPIDEGRGHWLRRLRGELDWIVMKALEKEPEHRYGSAGELGSDVEAFLLHRPVVAGPPSGLYRMRKFVRRYRVQVASAALVLLSLILGLFGTLWYLLESKANEASANRRADEAVTARQRAEGIRLATEAALITAENPNKALLLALEASELADDPAVGRTILGALPHHCYLHPIEFDDHDVRQLEFLPDGRLLALAETHVALLDSDTGAVLSRFIGHRDTVQRFAVDAGGKRLVTASKDGTARLWEIESGACSAVVDEGDSAVRYATFSPDGTRFATVPVEGGVRIYEVEGGTLQQTLAPESPASRAAFGPRGSMLAIRSSDHTTRIFDLGAGTLVSEFLVGSPGSPAEQYDGSDTGLSVLFTSDGNHVISQDKRGGSWNLAVHTTTGELQLELPDTWEPHLLSGHRLLFSSSESGGSGIVDLRSMTVERHDASPTCSITPTPDGLYGIAVDRHRDLCLVDLESGTILRRYTEQRDKRANPPVAIRPDGACFAFGGSTPGIWSLSPEYASVAVGPVPKYSQSLALGARTLALVVDCEGSCRRLVDVDSRRTLVTIPSGDLQMMALSPDGTRLIGMRQPDGSPSRRVEVFDLEGRVEREIVLVRAEAVPEATATTHAHVSDDGRLLVSWSQEPDPFLWCHDLSTGELLGSCAHSGGSVRAVRREPPWALVSLLGGGRTEIVDWRTGEVVRELTGPRRSWHIATDLSPDGRKLVMVLGDPSAAVYDLEAGEEAPPIVDYRALPRSDNYRCGFLTGGRRFWVMSSNEVHIVDVPTGALSLVLRLDGICAAVAEAPDREELVTLTVEGRYQRWPMNPLEVARRQAVGHLEATELETYEIGNPAERRLAERARLEDSPTPRNLARAGELALEDGDLDGAIARYREVTRLGLLGPMYAKHYLRALELICRRLGDPERDAEQRAEDRSAALTALELGVWCETSREDVLAVPGIDLVGGLPAFEELLAKDGS